MTIEDKREDLEKFCFSLGKNGCSNCPLSITFGVDACDFKCCGDYWIRKAHKVIFGNERDKDVKDNSETVD